jgi:hypothetical protein
VDGSVMDPPKDQIFIRAEFSNDNVHPCPHLRIE